MRYLGNSLIVTGASVAAIVVLGAMAAYALIFGLALAAISLKYDRDPSDHTS